MIDIHSHILAGFGDGAQTVEESMAMVKSAADEGVRKIVATPSYSKDGQTWLAVEVLEAVSELNVRLHEAGIAVEILPGQAIEPFEGMREDLKAGELLPLNQTSHYVLLELPDTYAPLSIGKIIFNLQIGGFIPIIAHPETNEEFAENPNKLYHLVKNGALCQVNASSVVGKAGKKTQKLALDLLEHNLMHFIASDARQHSRHGLHLQKARQVVQNRFGNRMAYLLCENAEAVVDGIAIQKEEPIRFETRKMWNIFSK